MANTRLRVKLPAGAHNIEYIIDSHGNILAIYY